MKVIKFTLIAFMAMFIGMNFASCNKEDEPTIEPDQPEANLLIGTKWTLTDLDNEDEDQAFNIEFLDEETCALDINEFDVQLTLISSYIYDDELEKGMILIPMIEEMVPFEIENGKIIIQEKTYTKDTSYVAPSKTNDLIGSVWRSSFSEENYIQFEFYDDQRIIYTLSETDIELVTLAKYTLNAEGDLYVTIGDETGHAKIDGDKIYLYDEDGVVETTLSREKE